MIVSHSILPPLLFLLGVTSVVAVQKTLQLLGRMESKKIFHHQPYFFFSYTLINKLFPQDSWNRFSYCLSLTKHCLTILYATTSVTYFFSYTLNKQPLSCKSIIFSLLIIIVISLLCELLCHFIASINPPFVLSLLTPITAFFVLLFFPLTFFLLKGYRNLLHNAHTPSSFPNKRVKDKILEVVHESELSRYLNPFDRKIITAIASFRDRFAREIMVPRIDMVTLSVTQTIDEAVHKFIAEGYSRIPVYNETIDTIVGVLLYKDVMGCYLTTGDQQEKTPLDIPLQTLIKPILYTPETKKISLLLQEFRSQQIHLAIVVDEYGGTDGIVTIEDILEELVGEIADEFDSIEEEKLHVPHPDGGWMIDGKMTIFDLQKETGIIIPSRPEYDTIGGYIFYCAGTIPPKGWKIHHDHFDLEIIASNERVIDTVLILPSHRGNRSK